MEGGCRPSAELENTRDRLPSKAIVNDPSPDKTQGCGSAESSGWEPPRIAIKLRERGGEPVRISCEACSR